MHPPGTTLAILFGATAIGVAVHVALLAMRRNAWPAYAGVAAVALVAGAFGLERLGLPEAAAIVVVLAAGAMVAPVVGGRFIRP